MAIITQWYDKLISQWKTNEQIKQQIIKTYWADSNQMKQFDSFLASRVTTTPTTPTTPKVPTTPTTTVTPTKPATTPITPTKPATTPITPTKPSFIQTPEQAKIEGVKNLTAQQIKEKNLGLEDKNLTILSNLRAKGLTDEDIKKEVVKKYWVESEKIKAFDKLLETEKQKQSKKITDTSLTKTLDATNLLKQKEDDLVKTKWEQITIFKNKDLQNAENEYLKWAALISKNNQNLLDLYWIDANWNIDNTKTNSFAYKIEKSRKEFEDTRNQMLNEYKWTRLAQVQWQIVAGLASRWIDISKIPQEQLLALSWQIGQQAFTDIYNAKEKALSEIDSNNKQAETQIMWLQEKWVISTNEANQSIELLRAKTEANKLAIEKQFANDIFWVVETRKTEKEAEKTQATNTITSIAQTLWLSWSQLTSLNDYLGKYSTSFEALQAMIKDLSNPNSNLRKNVLSNEQAAIAAAKAKADLEAYKAETARISAINNASSSTKSSNLTQAQSVLSASLWLGSDYKDVIKENYETILSSILQGKWFILPDWKIVSDEQAINALNEYRKYNIWAEAWETTEKKTSKSVSE